MKRLLRSCLGDLRGVILRLTDVLCDPQPNGSTPDTTPAKPGDGQEMLDTQAVADILRCSYGEARLRMFDGRIRAVKDGKWLRSRRAWVEEYIERKTVRPQQKPEAAASGPRKRRAAAGVKAGGIADEFLLERKGG